MSIKPNTNKQFSQVMANSQKNQLNTDGNYYENKSNQVKASDKVRNIKLLKISQALKNIYSNETGEILNSLKQEKTLRLSIDSKFNNKEKLKSVDSRKEIQTYSITNTKNTYHDDVFNTSRGSKIRFPNIEENKEKLNFIDNTTTPNLIKFRDKINQLTNLKKGLIKTIKFKSKSNILSNTDGKDLQFLEDNEFQTEFLKKNNENNKQEQLNPNNLQFCPFCDHCNQMKDEKLEQYFYILKDVKSIISRSFEYLINSKIINNLNLFINEPSRSNNSTNQIINNSNNNINQNQESSNYVKSTYNGSNIKNTNNINSNNTSINNFTNPNLNLNPNQNFSFNPGTDTNSNLLTDPLFKNFPKTVISNRLTYQTLFRSLDALLEDKIGIEYLVPQNISDYFKSESLIATGLSFNVAENITEWIDMSSVHFDKELDKYFDQKFKNTIKAVLKKKNLIKEIFPVKDDDMIHTKKRFMYLFLIFIQILSEISKECKEKALLLYKFFKNYFAEQEKKWVIIINRFKDKISYYKNLCKLIIQQKNKHLDKIEKISDVLSQNRITKENLNEHKSLVYDLLNIINEKRDTIYLLESKIEIFENELKFWIHDYDILKFDNTIRDKMKNFDFKSVAKNLNQEMFHKKLSKSEHSLLVNADVYLLISGQRNYFFDQKNYYLSEINRLTELYQKLEGKKRAWKEKHSELCAEFSKKVRHIENELNYYKEKDTSVKSDFSCQTDVDYLKMNKLLLNNESVTLYKSMNSNRLINFVERIKFGCSNEKPISKKSLLNLIVDIYTEKAYDDMKYELEPLKKKNFDIFFYEYLQNQFKLKKSVKHHTEEILLTIIKYSPEDPRIEVFRKFLGIGDEQNRKEILEIYLILLKSLPISLYKIFEIDYTIYYIPTDLCFEILHNKFGLYNFVLDNKDHILKYSIVYENDIEIYNSKNKQNEKKFNLFLLTRFYQKSILFINDLLASYKSGEKSEELLENFIDPFQVANKEFKFNKNSVEKTFVGTFKIINGYVKLDEFFGFFCEKIYIQNKYL